MRLGLSTLSLRKPSRQQMDDFVEECAREGPNHLLVGATEGFEPPPPATSSSRVVDGWIEDFDAVKVGEGKEAFLTAREAVRSWRHMQLGWVETNRPAVKPGAGVCIAARLLCFWQRSPLEIVHVTDQAPGFRPGSWGKGRQGRGRERLFAFGQTTLAGHSLAGEESFTVRWKADDSVWYEVYAFSRANTALAVAAYPLRRFFQRRFRRDSGRRVQAAVAAA